jgi:putative ABC transport system ATP-binding protein
MTTTENPALAIMGLTKRFGTTTLWSALTFDAFPGTLTAVSGPSGAGKTTLLNCVGLLEDFDEGTVSYGARIFAPGYLRTSRKQQRLCLRDTVGFLFQNYGLVEQWNVLRNLQVPLGISDRKHRDQWGERVRMVLARVGMTGSEKSMIYTLSGGEQQRIAMARLLLKQPSVVLADEPTSALDRDNSDMVFDGLSALAENGAAVIISTHSDGLRNRCSSTVEIGVR